MVPTIFISDNSVYVTGKTEAIFLARSSVTILKS